MEHVDIAVIGAGIIGLSVAWELSRRGQRVSIVDRAGPATGASGVAAGMLAPLCEARDLPEATLRLALESSDLWAGFADDLERDGGLSVDLRRDGTLLVAADADELSELEQSARMSARFGLRYEGLSVRELRRRAGALHPRLAGGFLAADDHHVDPQATCQALVAALGRRGIEVRRGSPRWVEVEGGVDLVDPEGPTVRASRVVVAAGAWSGELVPGLPMVPVKGQVVALQGEELLPCVVRTPRVYLVPRAGGRLVVGASMEELGFDTHATAGVVMNLLREAWRVLPGLYDLRLEGVRVGLRPMLPDGIPAIGPVSERVFLATGHHRHGVLLAPATAARVVRGLVEGVWDPSLLPGRFVAG